MAFIHGKNTEVWVDGADLSTYFRNAELSVDVDSAETTTFTASWKTHIAGLVGSTYELEGLYDPTMGTVKDLLPTTAAVVTIGPGGLAAVDDTARLMGSITTSYVESAPVGDVVSFSWSVMSNDDVGFGVVLHPLGAETADGNGSTHTGPVGGTTTGAIAHLHVTSVSAGDSIVVSLEDSANGTDWAAIAGGAFASKNAAGAERLVIPGTIRRYTRAVWDITDNGGPSITFSVALART